VLDFLDQTGERRRISMPKGTTKAAAKDELRAYEDQVMKGVYLPENKVPTFKQVAADWIEHKRQYLRSNTWDTYDGHVRNHFHEFDPMKINVITVAKVEKFINRRQAKKVPLGTVRKVLVTLGQIFTYAVRHKYIDHNPLRDAERPRDTGDVKKETSILQPSEIMSLLEHTPDQKYRTLFLLAIMSGARQGELLGLKWSDFDFATCQVHIQRTFTKGCFFATKTRTSNRRIDLSPMVVTELKRWKLACPPTEGDLVFPNEEGKPLNYSNMMQRHYQPALAAAELPRIRFHDLRHSYASLMIHQKENIKYIQTQLGHSSPMVTLNVYAHLMAPTNQEAACRLENTIFGTDAGVSTEHASAQFAG
jgi:integrase